MARNITAVVITLNEERNVESVIASAFRVADEVIVVDSCSADRTVELAQKAGAKVIVQPYLGDGPQKNVGVPHARNDWVFSIDADERFDENAVEMLSKLDFENGGYDGYSVRRKTFVGDRLIKIWYPDRVTRLYNRKKMAYQESIGHASVVGGRVKDLECDLLHYSYKNYSDLVRRIDKFSARGAVQLAQKGEKVGIFSPVSHGLGRFFKQYLVRGGIKEGFDGLTISVISGFGAYMKYAMALEAQRESDRQKRAVAAKGQP